MAEPLVLCATEAAALVAPAAGGDGLGPLVGHPVLAVRLDDLDAARTVATAVAAVPAVVVGVVPAGLGPSLPSGLDGFDVLVGAEESSDPAVIAGSDPLDLVDLLASSVEASPAAAVALVQLLRVGLSLTPTAAVLAESWVYGLLQSGPAHRSRLEVSDRPSPRPRDGPSVDVSRHGDRIDVVLSRPEVRNAVDVALRDDLHAALTVALADPVAEVHLHGAGPSFCSGGDLGSFGTTPDPVTAHLVRSTRSPALLLATLGDRLVAHVHGAAFGAGAEWAAFAHRVIARTDATFRLPELGMGLVPGAGGTASLPRRIGRHRTAWMALTGATVDATTAARWGLVDEIVDDVDFTRGGPAA